MTDELVRFCVCVCARACAWGHTPREILVVNAISLSTVADYKLKGRLADGWGRSSADAKEALDRYHLRCSLRTRAASSDRKGGVTFR